MSQPQVKSAARVFRLLELFAERRKRLTVSEIANRLDWPVSSAHALLRCLTEAGYLTLHPADRSYFPSMQLYTLCDWIPTAVFSGREPQKLLRTLRDTIGETVTLSVPNGLSMEFTDILIGTLPVSMSVKVGDRFPLFASAIGLTALSAMPDDRVSDLLARPTANSEGGLTDRVWVQEHRERINERGFFVGYDLVVEGLGALAWPLWVETTDDVFVIAVAGPTGRIRAQEKRIADTADQLIARFLHDKSTVA